jgi:hypothetical protein
VFVNRTFKIRDNRVAGPNLCIDLVHVLHATRSALTMFLSDSNVKRQAQQV